eukprot:Nitzschia sp. Nitz4//scaffold179_size51476//21451//22833//NITZ4_006926-RA/size51476-processed-gene-0.42-mRNA-1//1//CDS//3329539216//7719//frame0
MSDASTLRMLLRQTDGSAPSIQQAAAAMMKHYDKSPGVSVVEWRNALHQARLDQHLPLLYVANETLQTSKRNRGNKFLEAFSPILGQALAFVCQENPSVVEKVRRTVKIWGDRRVFSLRYVTELLKGLDRYRDGPPSSSSPALPLRSSPPSSGRFSPPTLPPNPSKPPTPPPQQPKAKPTNAPFDIDRAMAPDSEDDASSSSSPDKDDGDDDLFGGSSQKILNIDLDLDKAAEASQSGQLSVPRKRRRTSGSAKATNKRRPQVLSTSSLMDLWTRVSSLQQRFDTTQTLLASIPSEYLQDADEDDAMAQLDTLVGDELLNQYKTVVQQEKRVAEQRKELHEVAQKRKTLEQEAIRYLPWLEHALKQDKEDLAFCAKVQEQLREIQSIHGLAKAARQERLDQELKFQQEMEEKQRKKQEEEERQKFLEMAMSKETEAKPGMVWNNATKEYQYRNTDESWRD